ncbi:MAG: hypothetical protein JW815_04085 [Candidatus Bathyarchaeota archaeon]|nr:hypothetical protein [Candidatus Bathyarchaeum sp.]
MILLCRHEIYLKADLTIFYLSNRAGQWNMEAEDELTATAIRTYIYLIKTGKPVGPREVMRGAELTSPSVAYRNLQKLMDMNLVSKDEYGNYIVKEKVGIKGYVWLGKHLLARFILFGVIFLVVLAIEIAILLLHLLANSSVEGSFWLLTIVTIVSAVVFLAEGLKWRKSKLST